jgi:FAD/FMN-containing dehydrogenase/Fe-S oxidoreductase
MPRGTGWPDVPQETGRGGASARARLFVPGADASGSPVAVDVEMLAADLRGALAGEVRFDAGSRALYATDASNYRQVPLGVVVPRDAGDVTAAVDMARRHGAPILGRGAGTSLAGQCCNAGVVFDFSKYMDGVLDIDAAAATARVQPGVVLDDLRAATERVGLTFGPDPATHRYCTMGGMIGNNSCGVHSVMASLHGPGPTTADNVESLEILTYRGVRLRAGATDDHTFARILAEGGARAEIFRRLRAFQERYAEAIRREFPRIPRRVSGYNLPALLPEHGFHVGQALVGSESTLALVLEARVRLIPALPHRVLVVLGFTDVFTAADYVPAVMAHRPVGLEGFDDRLVDDLRRTGLGRGNLGLLPEGGGWLLVEFGANTSDEALARARDCAAAMARAREISVAVIDAAEDQQRLWDIRESGLAATARVPGKPPTWEGWEDSAVPPERFGGYLRDLDALFRKFEYDVDLYGHFGQGCLHCRIPFDLRSERGIAQFRAFVEEAADLVTRYGGSLSGEHGDGQARGELLGRMFSPEILQAFREFKSIWDPDWKMNPGKVIDANPLDANLRLGADYDPPAPATWFQFPDDGGSFTESTLRCVGVGKCRKSDVGTMCPSYMVTREERHSTRGRARLLFEMLEGDPLEAGWQSDAVHDALDLCLACKACKSECPVHVDMATYKAEFLAHYYEQHWRPRAAYAFGWVPTWARLASRMPRLANFAAHLPGLQRLARVAAGMAAGRRIPYFARQTFREWFLARPGLPAGTRPRVILWPDTFNDHFHPETLRAAVEVLEGAGFAVAIPREPLCCGRPLYDFGMLRTARRRLEAVMDGLEDDIAAGVPIVGLEPSCVSVFRDELHNLFPAREDARRLRDQTLTLAEMLRSHADRLPRLSLRRKAIVHGHCHQQAIAGLDADREVLDRTGLQYQVLDSGCCGMAGAFGFERSHYDVSMALGERVLLPAVRTAARDTLVVADGFSCREQIAHGTDRRALHLAELLHMAMYDSPHGPAGDLPERAYVRDHAEVTLTSRHLVRAALVGVGTALLVRAAVGLLRVATAAHAPRRR